MSGSGAGAGFDVGIRNASDYDVVWDMSPLYAGTLHQMLRNGKLTGVLSEEKIERLRQFSEQLLRERNIVHRQFLEKRSLIEDP